MNAWWFLLFSIFFFFRKIAYLVPKRPYRVTGCGYPTGLSILINPFAFDYSASSFSSYGFRLLIHDSYTVPDENAETKIISSARESFVHINPESTYATYDINNLRIKERNCLFPYERRLTVMQRYSFTNCMWECRVNLIMKNCGCVPHSLANNGSYPVCDVGDVKCVIKNRSGYYWDSYTYFIFRSNNNFLTFQLSLQGP